MKNCKKTIAALLIAAVLLIVVSMTGWSETIYSSDEECARLSALQFDDYEDMTVSEFQNRVWKLTDTNEYRSLLERCSRDAALYEQRDSDALASFLFYTLEPLTAEKWQTRDFKGSTTTDYPDAVDNASLEFVCSLIIQNADVLNTMPHVWALRMGCKAFCGTKRRNSCRAIRSCGKRSMLKSKS